MILYYSTCTRTYSKLFYCIQRYLHCTKVLSYVVRVVLVFEDTLVNNYTYVYVYVYVYTYVYSCTCTRTRRATELIISNKVQLYFRKYTYV